MENGVIVLGTIFQSSVCACFTATCTCTGKKHQVQMAKQSLRASGLAMIFLPYKVFFMPPAATLFLAILKPYTQKKKSTETVPL